MGFRFQRRIKILPGVHLNFSKSGVSTSIGVRGAQMTFGKRGTRTTVGVPGTGLSYTHLEKPHPTVPETPAQEPRTENWAPVVSALLLIIALAVVVYRASR